MLGETLGFEVIIHLVQWGNRKPGWGRSSHLPGPGSVSWS